MSGTFEHLQVGAQFSSPTFQLASDRVTEIIGWAGYVHPLFTDPDYPKRVGFSGRIVPGELVLLVLGGLAEQTGVFDETTLALVELASVEFKKPAITGDSVRLNMEVVKKHASSSGRRGFVTFKWTCLDQADEIVLVAYAVLAFKID